MADGSGKFIEVNKLLDARPEIFSLPASVIVPVMIISSIVGMICYTAGLSGFMGLFTVIVMVSLHFFLFGREWWRLVVRLKSPPNWVRRDIKAVEFSLTPVNESKQKRRKV